MLTGYTRLVSWSVRHRGQIDRGSALLIFVGLDHQLQSAAAGFVPTEDTGRALIAVELPPGSRLDDTRVATEIVSKRIAARSDVKSVLTIGGTVLGSSMEVRKATFIVNLKDKSERCHVPQPHSSVRSRRTFDGSPTFASGLSRMTASASCRSQCWAAMKTP